jgi:SAM-dependent methyltransferase
MFDWDEYWLSHRESKEAHEFNMFFAKKISEELIDRDHNIKYIADFGCGYATILLELAVRYPKLTFFGFDASYEVIKHDMSNARKLGLLNINFVVNHLPETPTRMCFDLIICISTLHYIPDIGKAIINLYNALNPGGYLIFNYPNRYTRNWYIKYGDEVMRRRFEHVISGVNLLSLRKIRNLTGKYPRKFYSTKKENIYVMIRKK